MIATTEDALLDDVLAHPGERWPLLIYADWLADQGRGDEERACRWMAENGRSIRLHTQAWRDILAWVFREGRGGGESSARLPADIFDRMDGFDDDPLHPMPSEERGGKGYRTWQDAARSLGMALLKGRP